MKERGCTTSESPSQAKETNASRSVSLVHEVMPSASTFPVGFESSLHEMERIDSRKQPPVPSEPKKVQAVAPVSETFADNNPIHDVRRGTTDQQKAFTGMVVERSTSSLMNQSSASSQVSSSNPTKPVSRFKMQRANRG
ncbi:hypothetical protein QJS10_CPB22g00494 [Acorus calamus]|uniref:Uncharacterized protein n=1 Tax=Acorus calamus TaxID=4465 RepID=A0AAV9C0T0_ACOCL|nr:hypothetical protein QJS10_CPB22g00494 [Acorus calamus]